MPRKEYSFEVRDKAEELYVEHGLTYDELAEKLGVARNTLISWGAQGHWKERRKDYLEAKRTLKQSLMSLRVAMMKKAAESKNTDDIYAMVKLERLVQAKEKKPEEKAPDIDRPRIFLEDMEFIAKTLQEVDPEGLKVFARNFALLVDRFKEAHEKAA